MIAKRGNIPLQLNAIGSMFSIFLTLEPAFDAVTARRQDVPGFKKLFHGLLQQGVSLSPSPFEANFISLEHSKKDLRRSLSVFSKALEQPRER